MFMTKQCCFVANIYNEKNGGEGDEERTASKADKLGNSDDYCCGHHCKRVSYVAAHPLDSNRILCGDYFLSPDGLSDFLGREIYEFISR